MPMILNLGVRRDGFGKVNDFGAGNLRDEDFAAFHLFDAIHHKAHALIERKPEAGHAVIGDGDLSACALFEE